MSYQTLTNNDLRHVVARLPADVRKWVKTHSLVIGGGFIREIVSGGEVRDIDVFGPSKGILTAALKLLEEDRTAKGQRSRLHISKNADTLLTENRTTVQVIHRWTYAEPEAVVKDFDFTVCAAAIYTDQSGNWQSIIHPEFYSDLAARRLNYTAPDRAEDAGGSMLRAIKFVKRGYNIQPQSLGKVIARVASAVRWNESMSEQFAAQVITGKLREVDPLLVVDGIEEVEENTAGIESGEPS